MVLPSPTCSQHADCWAITRWTSGTHHKMPDSTRPVLPLRVNGKAVRIVSRDPVLFTLAHRMSKARIRGERVLMRLASRIGALDVVVVHQIGNITIGVSL